MLIQSKDCSPGDVVAFRLSNGEEMIAKFVSAEGTVYRMSRPVILGVQMVAANQAQLGFMPFMAGVNDDATLNFDSAHMTVKPTKARKDVADGYIKATSSIEIPNAQTTGLLRL